MSFNEADLFSIAIFLLFSAFMAVSGLTLKFFMPIGPAEGLMSKINYTFL